METDWSWFQQLIATIIICCTYVPHCRTLSVESLVTMEHLNKHLNFNSIDYIPDYVVVPGLYLQI